MGASVSEKLNSFTSFYNIDIYTLNSTSCLSLLLGPIDFLLKQISSPDAVRSSLFPLKKKKKKSTANPEGMGSVRSVVIQIKNELYLQ